MKIKTLNIVIIKKEKLKIQIEETGKALGYEHYRNDYHLDGKLIGSSSYDNNQSLHVGSFVGKLREKCKKTFYASTPKGIAYKLQKRLKKEK